MDLSAQPRAEQGAPIFFTVMLALLHLKKHLFGRFRSVMSTTTADGPQRIQISSSLRFGTKALKL